MNPPEAADSNCATKEINFSKQLKTTENRNLNLMDSLAVIN
jgi:hypothetical protein